MGADPLALPVATLAERLASGAVRATELAAAVAGRLGDAGLDWRDPTYFERQARHAEEFRLRQRALGTLHGLPVVLDVRIDVAHVPASHPLGGTPERDAALTRRLRGAGALLLGTGSGSAAARLVARRGVPLAVAVDADGSVASAASMVALRPTRGRVSLQGVRHLAPSLDAAVCLSQDLQGAAMLADAVHGIDDADRLPRPAPGLTAAASARPPVPPTISFVTLPGTEPRESRGDAEGLPRKAEAPNVGQPSAPSGTQAREPHAALADLLEQRAFTAELPGVFAEAGVQARRVLAVETAHAIGPLVRRHGDAIPAPLRTLAEEGEGFSATDYLTALDWRGVLSAGIDAVLERCDVVAFVDGSGLPAFLGLPTVTLPLLTATDGSPVAVHLAARRGDDTRLVRTAAWLIAFVLELEAAA